MIRFLNVLKIKKNVDKKIRQIYTKMVSLYHNRAHYYSYRKEMSKGESIMVNEITRRVEMERYITRIMLDLGVPAHLKGYHFIREAILISEADMEVVSSVTKLLYPEIARVYKTTAQKVERAIRNAIEVSWTRGNTETMEELFGYSSASGKGRPTNSEYIARIADKIRLDYRSSNIAS